LKNPKGMISNAKMPDFGFNDQEAAAMTTYLLSLTADEVPNSYILPLGNPPSIYAPQGEFGRIIDKYQCFTWHTIMGKGADHAPDLTPEGSCIQQGWLQKFLKQPDRIRPTAHEQMPNFRLSDSEIKSIYSYFRTTLVDDRVEKFFETMEEMDLNDSKGTEDHSEGKEDEHKVTATDDHHAGEADKQETAGIEDHHEAEANEHRAAGADDQHAAVEDHH
jgi:hypothetical protein